MEEPKDIESFINEQKLRLLQKPDCAASHYNLGVVYMNQGKFDEAIESFEGSIDHGVRMFEAFVNLGYIYFKDGDLEKVVKANLRAIEIEPRYARGYANLGFAYLQMGKTDEAIEALKKGLELNPEIVQAWCNLANAYLQKGDNEQSIETNKKMLQLARILHWAITTLPMLIILKENLKKPSGTATRRQRWGLKSIRSFQNCWNLTAIKIPQNDRRAFFKISKRNT